MWTWLHLLIANQRLSRLASKHFSSQKKQQQQHLFISFCVCLFCCSFWTDYRMHSTWVHSKSPYPSNHLPLPINRLWLFWGFLLVLKCPMNTYFASLWIQRNHTPFSESNRYIIIHYWTQYSNDQTLISRPNNSLFVRLSAEIFCVQLIGTYLP